MVPDRVIAESAPTAAPAGGTCSHPPAAMPSVKRDPPVENTQTGGTRPVHFRKGGIQSLERGSRLLRKEDLLDGLRENPCQPEGKRQRGRRFAAFEGIDGLTRHAKPCCEVGL